MEVRASSADSGALRIATPDGRALNAKRLPKTNSRPSSQPTPARMRTPCLRQRPHPRFPSPALGE